MSDTITKQINLSTEICCECGTVFGMLDSVMRQRRNDHTSFYCPNGHAQYYTGKTDLQKAKEEAERLRSQLALERQTHATTMRRAASAEHGRAIVKGKLAATKKRVANGVCPCCNRTFQDLAAHMKTKHPKYAEEEAPNE